MSGISKVFALAGATALLFLPLVAVHAQVYSDGYTNGYYPTTNSDQYYDNDYNSSSYNNSSYNDEYYNNGYNNNSYENGYYPQYYPSPTCTLSVTAPSTTGYGYGSSAGTVSWTTQNASTVYLSNVGEVNTYGSESVDMYPGETFTLSMTGPGGNGTCQNEYYPQTQQYQYPQQYTQPYSYYTPPSTYYPTYPVTYTPPPVIVIPIINRPVYNPLPAIRNWWSNTMHW
jgi:hypothetical protein